MNTEMRRWALRHHARLLAEADNPKDFDRLSKWVLVYLRQLEVEV